MNEVKGIFRSLGAYLLFLCVVALFSCEIIPNIFPMQHLSSLLLLTLSVCLFQYYRSRISQQESVKKLMLGIAAMLVLLFFLRAVKYSVFTDTILLKRFTWYLYYAPLLLIPNLFFLISLCIHINDTKAQLRKWTWTVAVTSAFILLVLTNDLHQWIFRFLPQFENWDRDYSHGTVFYMLTIWQYALYLFSTIILINKCRHSAARQHAYLILIPFAVGAFLLILLFLDKMPKPFGANLLEFPEVNGFMVAGILECCMFLGLIPTNGSYSDLMALSSVAAQITDRSGIPIYKSAIAADLTQEAINAPEFTQMDENTLLRKKEIPGGYGFWQEDITELNRINEALAETKERLNEESNIIRLQNELREKQRKIEQRMRLYDEIARRTVSQSRQIMVLSEKGLRTADDEEKDRIKRHITLLGVYIKRYANLMILGNRNTMLNVAELGLSLAESLHYLNYYGIPSEILNSAEGKISSETMLTAFAVYETLLEENLPQLAAVYINLSQTDTDILFKLNFEGVNADISGETRKLFENSGIAMRKGCEDNITYFTLILPRGGGNT